MKKQTRNKSSATALSTPAAVLVLVQHIKNPALSFDQLAQAVQKQPNVSASAESIRRFFQEHGLRRATETQAYEP